MPDPIATSKLALRDQLLAARKRLPLTELGERARATAAHLMAAPEIRRAAAGARRSRGSPDSVACSASAARLIARSLTRARRPRPQRSDFRRPDALR